MGLWTGVLVPRAAGAVRLSIAFLAMNEIDDSISTKGDLGSDPGAVNATDSLAFEGAVGTDFSVIVGVVAYFQALKHAISAIGCIEWRKPGGSLILGLDRRLLRNRHGSQQRVVARYGIPESFIGQLDAVHRAMAERGRRVSEVQME